MKNKLVWIVVVVLILVAIALKFFVKEDVVVDKPLDINIGDEFSIFDGNDKRYVLNYVIGDVTGDGINDMAIAIGKKEILESTAADNVSLVVYDSSTNQYSKIDLKKFSGESFIIELADFTGNGALDIMIVTENKGEYTTRIVTSIDNQLVEIFKAKDNKGLRFSCEFLDGFKVNVINRKLNVNNTIELQNDFGLNEKVFEQSGKFIMKDNRPQTTGFTNIELVQLSDAMGIKTTQRIIFNDNLNVIDEITCIWKYQDGKWQLKEASSIKMGNLLY